MEDKESEGIHDTPFPTYLAEKKTKHRVFCRYGILPTTRTPTLSMFI